MIGMIVSRFPSMSETFIAREFKALRDANVPLRIYSLKNCDDSIVHPDASSLIDITTYVAWNDWRTWLRGSICLLRRPIQGLRGLFWVMRYHFWPPIELLKALLVWLQSMALSERMEQDGVKHIHSHWATLPTTAAYLSSQWTQRPFSFTAHAWDIFVKNRSLAEKVRLAERTITCTDFNRKFLEHLCPLSRDKILLNYHGVDIDKFSVGTNALRPGPNLNSEQGNGEVILLSVGRLTEKKGFETLIDACGLLHRENSNFRCILVGNGPLKNALQNRIKAERLHDKVEICSSMPQDELRALYRKAFVFIMPSVVARNGDRDGIPNVLFEAMAMGTPVIATSISGIPEAIADQQTGLLVPPRDPRRLADAVKQLMREPSLAHSLGQQGRSWIEAEFSSDQHMQHLVAHMRSIARFGEPQVHTQQVE